MFQDPSLFLLWLILAVPAFWLLPRELAAWRQRWLLASSLVFVFAVAPWACVLVAWMWLAVMVARSAFARHRSLWVLAAALLLVALPLLGQRTVLLDPPLMVSLGIAFATLRALAMTVDGYMGRSPLRGVDVGVCLYFLPLYTVGPIETIQKFSSEGFASRIDAPFMARGLSRIALGLFKSIFIAEIVIAPQIAQNFPLEERLLGGFGSAEALAYVLLSFLYTYVNFSGVVDIAIGTSRLFGLRIIENFDFPLLARNLRDFWKRWHISLGRWITQYLYFPMVAKLRTRQAPYVATFVAFVLIGWWHGSEATHIAWGAFHGAGLCTVMLWQRAMKTRCPTLYAKLARNPIYISTAWALTLVYVAWVQTFSNQRSLYDALSLTGSLLGLSR